MTEMFQATLTFYHFKRMQFKTGFCSWLTYVLCDSYSHSFQKGMQFSTVDLNVPGDSLSFPKGMQFSTVDLNAPGDSLSFPKGMQFKAGR